MKKQNIILGGVSFLLVAVFASAIYFIVLTDKKSMSQSEALESQEIVAEKEAGQKGPSFNDNVESNDVTKLRPTESDEVISVETKDDAQKVMEEVDGMLESMDNTSL